MTAFEDLKSRWENQSRPEIPNDGAKKILEKVTSIQKKQQITNTVLGATVAVLISFFIYISAYKFQTVMTGLLLMICVLAVRIALEIKSIRTLKRMNITQDVERFKRRMVRYYTNRKKVHFIFTPMIILLYCIGFIMLLPSFKASLSEGFYTYILVSAVVVLVVLSVFIFKQIQKELAVLKELKD
jgi:hypothetical protein